jgi:O-antigen ligase
MTKPLKNCPLAGNTEEPSGPGLKKITPDFLMWAAFCGMFFFLPIGNSPVEICGIFIICVWIVSGRIFRDLRIWLHSGVAIPVSMMMMLPWIGLAYTPLFSEGFGLASKTYCWLYTIAIIPVISARKDRDLVIKMFLAGLALNAIISNLQFAGLVPLKDGNPSGLLGISSPWITSSLLLTVGIAIASFYFKKAASYRERILYLFLILLYFVPIGFLGGRSGYAAFAILSPLIIGNIIGKKHFLIVLVFSALAVSLLFTSPVVKSRLSKAREDLVLYQQGNVNTSIGLRLHMWEIAVSEIKKHPFAGLGSVGFYHAWETRKMDPSLPSFDHPHNSFLYMMVSFGIAGLITLCWLFLSMLKNGWRHIDTPLGFSLFSFTLVLIIGSITDTQILPFPTATALALFAGIAEAVVILDEDRHMDSCPPSE